MATKWRVDRGFRAGRSSSSGTTLAEMSTRDMRWPTLGRFLGEGSCSVRPFADGCGTQRTGDQGGVFLDFGQNFEGDFEGGDRLLAGDARWSARGDGLQEALKLQAKGLVFRDGERGE